MKNKLSSIEEAVLKKLLAGNLPLLFQLQQQIEVCSVGVREFTGFGFYTTMLVPENIPRTAGLDFKFGDVIGEISGLPSGAGFLLYIKDGVLDMLEGYSYDEAWPSSVNDFNLKYATGEERDWVALEKAFTPFRLMGKSLEKLISLSGAALSSTIPILSTDSFGFAGALVGDLLGLLKHKNGFYAFESALHVFPVQSVGKEIGLTEWNTSDLWIREYQGMANECLFFAEDIFGGQFCIKSDGIYMFDPEAGALEFLATDIEGWAQVILNDYETLTGYPLAHAWQQLNGVLAAGKRLVPKIPFATGGEFATENLLALESVKALQLRANLAIQIRDLPDGATISWKVTE